jgi:hypothetical protein
MFSQTIGSTTATVSVWTCGRCWGTYDIPLESYSSVAAAVEAFTDALPPMHEPAPWEHRRIRPEAEAVSARPPVSMRKQKTGRAPRIHPRDLVA